MEERGIPTIAAKRLDGSMPLGKEVGLAPCHIVLDGDPRGQEFTTTVCREFTIHAIWFYLAIWFYTTSMKYTLCYVIMCTVLRVHNCTHMA